MGPIVVQRGVTSGANKALSNLASIAINSALIPDGNGTRDLGSGADFWKDLYLNNVVGPTVFNDAGADVNFRFEGLAEQNLLFLDASTNRIGIGTDAPACPLDVKGNICMGSVGPGGTFFISGVSAFDDTFIAATGSGTIISNKTALSMIFRTTNTERMSISAAGDIIFQKEFRVVGNAGIGITASNYRLNVNGSFGFKPGTSVTPVDNGDVVIEATNNTTLTFKLKGTDAVVRTTTLTLT